MHRNEAPRLLHRGFEDAKARATTAAERPRNASGGTRGPRSGDIYTFIASGGRALNDLLDREAKKDCITNLSMNKPKDFYFYIYLRRD